MITRFGIPQMFENLIDNEINTSFMPVTKASPALDVSEQENEFVVIGELPGVQKQDVQITYENKVLTIKGVRNSKNAGADAKVLLNEIRVREFSRSLRFPIDIDAEKISAELDNGVLRVVLPKAQNGRARTIALK